MLVLLGVLQLPIVVGLVDQLDVAVLRVLEWTIHILLGVPSCVSFCQQEFGEFPRPAWAVGSYSSGPPARGTPQIIVDKTSRLTGRLRVYKKFILWRNF